MSVTGNQAAPQFDAALQGGEKVSGVLGDEAHDLLLAEHLLCVLQLCAAQQGAAASRSWAEAARHHRQSVTQQMGRRQEEVVQHSLIPVLVAWLLQDVAQLGRDLDEGGDLPGARLEEQKLWEELALILWAAAGP